MIWDSIGLPIGQAIARPSWNAIGETIEFRPMIVGERVKERMEAAGLSQAELARRVGMAQPSIFQLINRGKKGSTKLHLIARELQTTPAYLSGETDDPQGDAPPQPTLDADERDLIDNFKYLTPADRRALLQIARTMAGGPTPSQTVHAPARGYRGEKK